MQVGQKNNIFISKKNFKKIQNWFRMGIDRVKADKKKVLDVAKRELQEKLKESKDLTKEKQAHISQENAEHMHKKNCKEKSRETMTVDRKII